MVLSVTSIVPAFSMAVPPPCPKMVLSSKVDPVIVTGALDEELLRKPPPSDPATLCVKVLLWIVKMPRLKIPPPSRFVR
jgi:hypothetical protein